MAQIEDFGQKIGGARKDVWKLTGITSSDFDEMNDMERGSYVKKDNIWIKPDWEQKVAGGTPQPVAYWQNKMRQSLPPKPPSSSEDVQKAYISVVTQIRDAVMAVKDRKGIESFFNDFLKPNFSSLSSSYYFYPKPEVEGIVTDKVRKAAQISYYKLEREAKEKLFGIPKDEKIYTSVKHQLEVHCYDGKSVVLRPHEHKPGATQMVIKNGWSSSFATLNPGSEFQEIEKWKLNTYFVADRYSKPIKINFPSREEAEAFIESYAKASQISASINKDEEKSDRKKNFVPPQLSHVEYSGPKYRGIRRATSQMFLDDLKFRGGEFGNWLNNADRQTSLDMGYDALRNLADILKIPPEDISLNGTLAIAFGARGRGGAGAGAAHYEPLRQVINLTKMSGAGCLAHEWAHALDDAIGRSVGATDFATEAKNVSNLPESFTVLLDALKYKNGVVSASEQRISIDEEVEKAQKNIRAWISDKKPSNLPEDLCKTWDDTVKHILEYPETFTGMEYISFHRRDPVMTHPDLEILSQICKHVTRSSLPRENKKQVALWAKDLSERNKQIKALTDVTKRIKTDFYRDSIEFDKVFSKYGHGYWQSTCEMFARAFDCYISDKLKEQGYRSDFLSSHADSFSFRDGDRVVAAYPRGEEREAINKAFDNLILELKERQLLHDAPTVEQVISPERTKPFDEENDRVPLEPEKPVHYEQLSLDEILFAASAKAQQAAAGRTGKQSELSR